MRLMKYGWIVAVGLAAAPACGGPGEGEIEENVSPDGTDKETGGKGDAWDWRNDPARFQAQLNYKWSELPGEGTSNKVAWADTYWPTYQDSINDRWLGSTVFSPVEKYDQAFNNWAPAEGFADLKPYNPSTCEWDDAYYEGLGPAATYVARNKGNWRSHNGVDDDNDGIEDKDECGFGENKDRDGVETWWGLCHAWVPAAILEDEPLGPVTRNGVTFEVADMKALLVGQHDRSDAFMLGGRCNDKEVERDDTGRIDDSQCRDVNAGAFHVIVTNFLGINSRPFAEDRTYNYEVWNQPVVGYKITEQEEIPLEEVNAMLNAGTTPDEEGQPTTDEEIAAVLRVANELNTAELIADVGLRDEEAEAIAGFKAGGDGMAGTADDPTFTTMAELEGVFNLGPRAFARMLEYARTQGWAPAVEPAIYSYNDDAVKFVRIRMTLDYITESQAETEPTGDRISRFTRSDHYTYILEIDENDEVIGGEWVGSSISNHPDFLWLPTRARSGNPNVDIDTIREMIQESRGDQIRELDFASTESMNIPDEDPDGASTFIEISDAGTIDSLTLDVDITHTYRGDLLVVLEKVGAQKVVVFDGYEVDNRSQDNVNLAAHVVDGFEGVDLAGQWRLWVVDSLGADTGAINGWTLHAKVK